MLVPENANPDTIEPLFPKVDGIRTDRDADGNLRLWIDKRPCFIIPITIGEARIQLMSPSEASHTRKFSRALALDLANELNQDIAKGLTAFVDDDDNLVYIRTFPLKGGLVEDAFLYSVFDFLTLATASDIELYKR